MSWSVARLDAVAESCLGKMLDKRRNRGTLRPYLRNLNVRWGHFDLSDLQCMAFEDNEVERYTVRSGDVVVCEGGEPGRCAVWSKPDGILIQKALHRVRCSPRIVPTFLAYWLRHCAHSGRLAKHFTGTTIRHLPGTALDALVVPCPPVAVQRDVVAAIEVHFSRLDASLTSLARAKANVKRARASVLKAAVEGRLVPTEAALARAEGRDYEPASVLLERILTERKAQWVARSAKSKYKPPTEPNSDVLPEMPEGWALATIDAVAAVVTDGDHNPPKRQPEGIPHLTAKSVKRGQLLFDDCSFVSEEGFAQTSARYSPMADDIIVTCVGTVGEVATVRPGMKFSADRNLAGIRLVDVGAVPYVALALTAPHLQKWLAAASGSTAQPHLYLRDLRRASLLVPPLAEQRRIVAEGDRRLSVLDALDAAIDANLVRCARLRQAILKRAFEGRLVPSEDDAPAGAERLEREVVAQ